MRTNWFAEGAGNGAFCIFSGLPSPDRGCVEDQPQRSAEWKNPEDPSCLDSYGRMYCDRTFFSASGLGPLIQAFFIANW